MGITSSLQQFLKSDAISQAFGQYESTGIADEVCFGRELEAAVAEGRVEVKHTTNGVIGDSTWEVTKVVWTVDKDGVEPANIDARQFGARGNALTQDADGLRDTDNRSKAVQKTPWRVSLDAMKRRVKSVEYIFPQTIPHMTIAVVMLDNGYALQGKSAPADPDNFNKELGQQYAYEDALRQLWALEAYVMRDYISGAVSIDNASERWAAN